MVRHRFSTIAAVAALVLVTAGCAGGGGRDQLTIGALYPISGHQGPGGVEEADGARLAVELANQRGGVHGRKVRLELVGVEAGASAPAAMDALHRRGIDVVLGT